MLSGEFEVLVGLGHLRLQVGDCVRVVVGELESRLQLGRSCDDVLGEVPATTQQFLFLLMGVAQCAVDSLVLDAEPVEGLVGAETGEDFLELGLQLLVGDGLNAELLRLVVHFKND